MRILFLSRWYPYPTDNGSKIRIWNLLRGLSSRHEVSLLSFGDEESDPDLPEMRAVCREVKVVPWRQYNPHSRRARLGFFNPKPRSYIDTFSHEMRECITKTLAGDEFDLIIASQWEMAGYSSYFSEIPAIFEEVELGIFHQKNSPASSQVQRIRDDLTWYKYRLYLSRLLRDFQACTVVSKQEQGLVQKTAPNFREVVIIPNCVDLSHYAGVENLPVTNSLIFTGSFKYAVNYDAMAWFLRDIYPYVRSQIPEVHLNITGHNAGRELPSTSGVTLTGFLPDIRPLIASSWASVVPLLDGGGTRLKILEAMALRTPVITTRKGAEGLDVEHEDTVLIADEPEEFAKAVVRLLKEPELRVSLSENAYQLVRERYNWATVMPRFLQLIEETTMANRNQKTIDYL